MMAVKLNRNDAARRSKELKLSKQEKPLRVYMPPAATLLQLEIYIDIKPLAVRQRQSQARNRRIARTHFSA
jgi:hypothetical protein